MISWIIWTGEHHDFDVMQEISCCVGDWCHSVSSFLLVFLAFMSHGVVAVASVSRLDIRLRFPTRQVFCVDSGPSRRCRHTCATLQFPTPRL